MLDKSIRTLKGVGDARLKALSRLGLSTVRDLLLHFPRAYQNRGLIRRLAEAPIGERAAFLLTVASEPISTRIKNRITVTKLRVFDESGSIEAVFFNQPYLRDVFHVGMTFRFWGTVTVSGKRRQLASPLYEKYTEGEVLPDFIPVYPIAEGLTQKLMTALTDQALSIGLPYLEDPLPESVRARMELPVLRIAVSELHRPSSGGTLARALRRIVFDELLALGLAVSLSKSERALAMTEPCRPTSMKPLLEAIPYELTNAQKRVINEIYSDMTGRGYSGSCPAMRRILIGDVGSGKTICAAAAALIAMASGRQVALMVPTSILAHQHYEDLASLFGQMGYEVALLTGATKASERKRILARLSDPTDPLPMIIGTHALLSENVVFADLALTITDEQHRFGVMQRARLKEKYSASHTLVMSATPIPRTLAHVLYGDLSVSRIDEMPKGRLRVDTHVVGESYRERLNAFIRRQVKEGGQVYVVCPSIEEKADPEEEGAVSIGTLAAPSFAADAAPLKNAVDYAENLKKIFPEIPSALLHGKMKQSEKDAVMARFVSGEVKILVSTTVIEVGVNVPDATLMIVENADRFGLSQLHQLRGRVGRGKKRAWCVLVSDSHSETARSRLNVMQSTYDGYEIAEQDLALRGPGDFFSGAGGESRQSGGLSLRLASCCNDTALMQAAFSEAADIVRTDPRLSAPEHLALRREVDRLFEINENTVS